tara:strand:- start:90 stop:1058 length:969 start_codon:yes stop_codon:yes gene_type:complete
MASSDESSDPEDEGPDQRSSGARPKPPRKRAKVSGAPVTDPRLGVRCFLQATIERQAGATCALRYPSKDNYGKLADDGGSLFAIYQAFVFEPVAPSTFSSEMREFKGHAGKCKGGCGCLIDGVNHLKSIHFKTDKVGLASMLVSLKNMNLLDSAWNEIHNAAGELCQRLVALSTATTRRRPGGGHRSPSPVVPSPVAPAGNAPVRIESAALRTSRTELERAAELLAEAADLLPDEPAGSRATIVGGIRAAAAIVRGSLPAVEVPSVTRDTYRMFDLCVKHSKLAQVTRDEIAVKAVADLKAAMDAGEDGPAWQEGGPHTAEF